MRSPILSVRLFGSHARGDAEERSDVDILCILDSVTEQQKIEALSLICAAYGQSASVTFYGHQRFSEMFDEGHLFAWHIFTESRPLHGLTDHDWIANLGKPHPYTRAIQDVRDLADIMASIPENLKRCPANTVYEAGLLYLCLRNIAISLSIDYPSQLGSLPHVPRLPPCIHTWISPKSSEPRVRACGDKSLLGLVHKEHKDTSTQ